CSRALRVLHDPLPPRGPEPAPRLLGPGLSPLPAPRSRAGGPVAPKPCPATSERKAKRRWPPPTAIGAHPGLRPSFTAPDPLLALGEAAAHALQTAFLMDQSVDTALGAEVSLGRIGHRRALGPGRWGLLRNRGRRNQLAFQRQAELGAALP